MPSSVRGLLLGRGALDEQSDERLVVVQDHDGKPRYARVWADRALDAVAIGGVIEVGRGSRRRWSVVWEIIPVAKSNEAGIYSTGAHRDWLRRHRPSLTAEQVERRLREFSRHVARFARQPESGITRSGENTVRVNVEVLERFTAQRARWLDVRIHAAHSLKSQITAEAYTWIDRQIIRTGLSESLSKSDITHAPAVRAAMIERADWLVQHGFAERDTDAKDKHSVRFPFGATDRLKTIEAKKFAQRCQETYGKGFSIVRARSVVRGVYFGVARLHCGTFAMVATKERFYGESR